MLRERGITMKRSILGFAILVAISGYLCITGLVQSIVLGSLTAVPLAIAVTALFSGYVFEWPTALDAENPPLTGSDLKLFISVIGGALASYYLNIVLGLGGVLGAGLVAVLAALILPSLSVPITCGSFCGMTSPKVLPGMAYLLLAAAIAGVIFVLAKEVMNGFGGKLGAIAASGCTLAALLTGNQMLAASVPDWPTGKYIVLITIISAEASFVINTRLKHGAVMGTGIVSVVGGLVLPALFPDIGGTLAIACACGSYAGMSTRARIANEWFMAIVGIVSGLMFVWATPYLGGIGGRLGTIALGSVIAIWGAISIYRKIAAKR